MTGRPLPPGEGRRKLVHAAMGLFALLLAFLTWRQAALCAVAAFLVNWLLLPRLLGSRLASARAGSGDRGVLLYPLVVLALIVLFRDRLDLAALGWGVLAFGDAAAGVVGQKWGRRPLPWNPAKTWEGTAAFFAAGLVGGGVLELGVFWLRPSSHPLTSEAVISSLPWFAVLAVPVVLAALLESVPHGLDDNVLPVLAVPALVHLAGSNIPFETGGVLAALAVNLACAAAALATRAMRPGGVAAASLLGVAVWLAGGWEWFLVLLAFLLLGSAATWLGYRRKHAVGLAEAEGGRRGAAEVIGKGGLLLAFATTAVAYGHFSQTGAVQWVVVAILAAATADTLGTEIGSLYGRRAWTLWPLRQAPPGTPGAVSVPGLLAALGGAAMMTAIGGGLGLLFAVHPWRLGLVCTGAAFVATMVESLLPRLGETSHLGKNLAVTLLAPLLVLAAVGTWP
jgi:uncharacterized protein (TIGR00297 family)